MKFEIRFDEKLYRKQINLSFNISWEKSLKESKNAAIYALVFIALGIAMLLGNAKLGYLFLIFGISLIITAIIGLNKYLNAKKGTSKLLEKNIKFFNEKPISIWEFENDYFRFEYFGGDFKFYWNYFKYYDIIDKNILFGTDANSQHFILSECEVGTENFNQIAELLKEKINTTKLSD